MKLIESEKFAFSLLTNSPHPIIVINSDTSIRYVNPALEKRTGFSSKELIGVKPPYPWMTEERIEQTRMNGGKAMRTGAHRIEELFKKKNGEQFWAEIASTPVAESGKLRYILENWTDITDRKRAEEELRRSREQLRSLADHLQSVREEERTAIAREIHDDLGQALTGLKMDLSWLAKKLPENEKALIDKIQAMSDLTNTTLKTVQRISTELRPGLLDDLGLVAAIEWQTEEFQNRTGIRCKLIVDPEEISVDEKRSTALFRILQEALTNVARHAQATRVTVSLKEKNGTLELRVKDNGKGIAKEKISNPRSFGLLGIRERVHLWGGNVMIRGVKGKGTEVEVRIPIEEVSRKGAKDAKKK
jgi:PAS domain S-box-containing protein